ncbi:hypothetical protein [Pseudomonas hormoni]
MHYSFETRGFYIKGIHKLPGDAVEIIPAEYAALLQGVAEGKQITRSPSGLPLLTDPMQPSPSAAELCAQIDKAADSARRVVAGDPLRAMEYERAAAEAEAYKATSYQGDVPRTVAAWAINGRTARQAAESILVEAAAYTEALYCIRETRLQAKSLIRAAMAEGNIEQAQDITAETIAAIETTVAGIGNNASV